MPLSVIRNYSTRPEDFEALCEEYNGTEAASEDDANAETAYPYNEEQGKYRTSMSTLLSDWLFDDARQEGDVTVLTDEDAHKCYVVEFDSRRKSTFTGKTPPGRS